MPIDAQAQEYFSRHRRVWKKKPVLRRIYKEEFFARLLSFRKNDGVSVEEGAGPGFFKQTLPSVISTDIVWCPWLDAVADAQKLPFQSSTVANIFGVDMMHHLASPMTFLLEAQRLLLPPFLYPAVSKIERVTTPLWRRCAGLRVLLVLENSLQP